MAILAKGSDLFFLFSSFLEKEERKDSSVLLSWLANLFFFFFFLSPFFALVIGYEGELGCEEMRVLWEGPQRGGKREEERRVGPTLGKKRKQSIFSFLFTTNECAVWRLSCVARQPDS